MKRSFTLFCLIATFYLLLAPALAQEGVQPMLTPIERNTVFARASAIPWEAGGAIPMEILPYEGGWILFYLGGTADQGYWQVGIATSEDGLRWTRYADNPVFTAPSGLGPNGIRDFTVFRVGDQWAMLFATAGNSTVPDVRLATASAPMGPWSLVSRTAIAAPRRLEWDGAGTMPQSVGQLDDEYVLYFLSNGKIGRATSRNGSDWSLYDDPETTRSQVSSSDPVFVPHPDASAWDHGYVSGILTRPRRNGWEMFYAAQNVGGHDEIGYATSTDGINWNRQGDAPILADPDAYMFVPVAVAETNGASYFYYFSSTDRNPANGVLKVASLLIQGGEEDPVTGYVVASSQNINARSCPRLDCAVVTTFAPGTVLGSTGTTTGDVVAGSDQWAQISIDGSTAYVHLSLLEVQSAVQGHPVTLTSSPPATATPAPTEPQVVQEHSSESSVQTTNWTDHAVGNVRFLAPGSWVEIQDLLDDEDYWSYYERVYGKVQAGDLRAWAEDQYDQVLTGVYDMVITSPYEDETLYIWAEDWSGTNLIPQYWQRVREAFLTDDFGAELLTSELVQLPVGEGIHLVFAMGSGTDRRAWEDYAVIVGDTAYVFDLAFPAAKMSFVGPRMEAIADSISVDETPE